MNEKMVAPFLETLKEIRSSLIGVIKVQNKTIETNQNQKMPDITESAVLSYDQELMLGLGEQESKTLRLVEEAIKKIENGQYGICLECEQPIPQERLKAIPFAAHCVDCLEAIERKSI